MKLVTRTVTMLAIAALTAMEAVPAAGAAAGDPVPPPSTSTSGADPAPAAGQPEVDPAAAAALASERGISVSEATKRLGQQKALGDQGGRIEKMLAGRSGGTFLDADGRLVVTTIDAAGDAVAVRDGARAQRVTNSSARLGSIMRQLDQQAAREGAGSVQGWYLDVPANVVVVTVTEGANDQASRALTRLAASFGGSVRITQAPADQAPEPTAEYIAGGLQVVLPTGGNCSVGFNALDSSNRNVEVTAGHCVKTSGNLSRNGYIVGATRTANYPTDDFGTFWNSYPSYWVPTPSVYKYNNTYARLAGQWNTPTVGATVCKSGRTTGYTCGTITALNQSVNYGAGVIYGLVRHNACVEPGDSGGSNISAGLYALGITSGAALPTTKQCLSKSGGQNVSWYQPVGEALTRNGLRLRL